MLSTTIFRTRIALLLSVQIVVNGTVSFTRIRSAWRVANGSTPVAPFLSVLRFVGGPDRIPLIRPWRCVIDGFGHATRARSAWRVDSRSAPVAAFLSVLCFVGGPVRIPLIRPGRCIIDRFGHIARTRSAWRVDNRSAPVDSFLCVRNIVGGPVPIPLIRSGRCVIDGFAYATRIRSALSVVGWAAQPVTLPLHFMPARSEILIPSPISIFLVTPEIIIPIIVDSFKRVLTNGVGYIIVVGLCPRPIVV